MIPEAVQARLAAHNMLDVGEVALRELLEQRVETYTLFKLAPWPTRRWKCRYRLMMRDECYDAQSAAEAYALALLATLEKADTE